MDGKRFLTDSMVYILIDMRSLYITPHNFICYNTEINVLLIILHTVATGFSSETETAEND